MNMIIEIKLGVAVLKIGIKLSDFSKFIQKNRKIKKIKLFESLLRK